MAFTRRTELRHISPAELTRLAQILEQRLAWKKLMQSVPFELPDWENLSEGKSKYKPEHIDLIDRTRNGKMPSQNFLEEWSTSGKIRPTLSHLLQLLVKCELFRAADYVAENLLSEPPPTRPSEGPAAKINIDLHLQDDDNSISEALLNMDSPRSSALVNLDTGPNNNKDFYNKKHFNHVTKVNVPMSEVDLIRFSSSTVNNSNLERHRPVNSAATENNAHDILSITAVRNDLSNHSNQSFHPPSTTSNVASDNEIYPDVSILRDNHSNLSVHQSHASTTDFLPNISAMLSPNSNKSTDGAFPSSTTSSIVSDNEIYPDVSILRDNHSNHFVHQSHASTTDYIPNISTMQSPNSNESTDDALPNISFLGATYGHSEDSTNIPNLSNLHLQNGEYNSMEQESSEHIPRFSALFVQPSTAEILRSRTTENDSSEELVNGSSGQEI